jgi:predicted small metal-binding protein
VTDVKGKICGHMVAGKNATNLKAHLKVHHPELYKEIKENETEKIKRNYDDLGKFAKLCL